MEGAATALGDSLRVQPGKLTQPEMGVLQEDIRDFVDTIKEGRLADSTQILGRRTSSVNPEKLRTPHESYVVKSCVASQFPLMLDWIEKGYNKLTLGKPDVATTMDHCIDCSLLLLVVYAHTAPLRRLSSRWATRLFKVWLDTCLILMQIVNDALELADTISEVLVPNVKVLCKLLSRYPALELDLEVPIWCFQLNSNSSGARTAGSQMRQSSKLSVFHGHIRNSQGEARISSALLCVTLGLPVPKNVFAESELDAAHLQPTPALRLNHVRSNCMPDTFREAQIQVCLACGSYTSIHVDKEAKYMACGRCSIALYCSTACQTKHWREGGHKQDCSKICL